MNDDSSKNILLILADTSFLRSLRSQCNKLKDDKFYCVIDGFPICYIKIINKEIMNQHYTLAPLIKSRQRPRVSSRRYVSDYEANSLYNHGLKSRQVSGDKLKLVEIDSPLGQSAARIRKRVHSYYDKEPEEQELSKIKKDVSKLEYQILKRKNRLKGKLGEVLVDSRSKIITLPQQLEIPSKNTYQLRRTPQQKQKSLWLQSENLGSPVKKKLYKIKNKRKKFLLDTTYDQDQNRSFFTLKYSRERPSYYQEYNQRPVIYKARHPPKIARFLRTSKNVQRFRKIANTILFTIRLRTYNERMRIRRFQKFKKYVHEDLNKKLLHLKNEFILCSKHFFTTLIDQQNFDYRLHESDEAILKRQKISSVCKLVNLQVKFIQKCIRQATSRETFAQLLYFLCKHGNYSCAWELNTAEQFNLLCISQNYGYVSADKYLEQSAIISLVFIKILLFNIFLQPERIDIAVSQNINLKVIFSNVKLVGNILYQLFLDIQDQMLNKAPCIYTVGNWTGLRNTFKFKVSESMTVRQGFVQKNELISGLASNKYIRDIYGTKSMAAQRQILKAAIKQLHQNIVDHHVKVRHLNFVR